MFLMNRTNQFWPAASFRGEMSRMFDDMIGSSTLEWSPALDVSETDQAFQVRLEVPGMSPEQIDIQVEGDHLVISGEKKDTVETNDKGYFHKETRYGQFSRKVVLPEGVDREQISAESSNGVLSIMLPKLPQIAPKKISVNTKRASE